MYYRFLEKKVLESLKTSPIVFLNGPRQSGKSTLVSYLSEEKFKATYITLDHSTQMAAATAAPHAFLTAHKRLIIDEVQLVPELFRELKIIVDERRLSKKGDQYGLFLMTGSANIMALPKLSDALVGRMSLKTLYPLSAVEVFKGEGLFLSALFAKDFSQKPKKHDLQQAILASTFPQISLEKPTQRLDWFEGYLTTLLQRDVRLISDIDKLGKLPLLLRILSMRVGNLLNDASIGRDVGLNAVTTKNYREVLLAMFLTFDIQPWFKNIKKRLVKSPKGYLLDTNLLCHLMDWDLSKLFLKPDLFGHVIENFVATELVKLLSFDSLKASLYHFRTSDGKEVDFVIQKFDQKLVGIEVKAKERVTQKDFEGLMQLQAVSSDDFVCGVVLYLGSEVVVFGDSLFAVPISYLWL